MFCFVYMLSINVNTMRIKMLEQYRTPSIWIELNFAINAHVETLCAIFVIYIYINSGCCAPVFGIFTMRWAKILRSISRIDLWCCGQDICHPPAIHHPLAIAFSFVQQFNNNTMQYMRHPRKYYIQLERAMTIQRPVVSRID